MSNCELLSTCPFFNDKTQEMSELTEMLKEDYCYGNFAWCGRYMAYRALERDRETEEKPELATEIH